MADIIMTYEGLNEAARKITQAEKELDSLIYNLTKVVDALGTDYKGVSYEAFKSAWEASKPTMEKLKVAVGAFSPALKSAAEKQRETETATAGKMAGLSFN